MNPGGKAIPMKSSRIGTLAAAVLIVGMSLGVLAINVAADSPPVWSVGDYWKFSDPTDPQNYSRFEVSKIDAKKTVAGETFDCYELTLEQTVKQGSQYQSLTGTLWMRKTDLAYVAIHIPVFGITVSYNPPRKLFDWPLEVGRIWTWVDDSNPPNKVTYTYKVEGTETVTTKAGTFETFRISEKDDTTWSTTRFTWYSSVAGFQVKTKTDGSDSSMELAEYKHATGGLFPAGFGPESMMFWFLIIGLVVIIAVVAMVLLARRKKKGAQPAMAPPAMMPAAPPQQAYQPPPQYPQGGYQQQPYQPGATDQSGRVVPGASQMVRR